MRVPTAAVAASGLVGGFAAGNYLHRRDLAGVVALGAAAVCARQWLRTVGPTGTAGLLALYVGGLGASHPLAKKIGAWPAVLAAAGASAAASLVADRQAGLLGGSAGI